uniref:Solanesyl diphosphate synthase 1 n=1 Tax=Globodera pallida TaxID=36090 RepID=A0A183C1J5_GLOPA
MFITVRCCLSPTVRRSVLPMSSNGHHHHNNQQHDHLFHLQHPSLHHIHCRPFTLFALGNKKGRQSRPAEVDRSRQSLGDDRPPQQCSSAMGLELPLKINERLSTLKEDVLSALLDKNAVPPELISSLMSGVGGSSFSKALELVPSYNQNLQKMAKYYFTAKGGKLIRPTVSLLMSAACNQHSKKPSSATVPSRSGNVISSATSSDSSLRNKSSVAAAVEESEKKPIDISFNQYRIAMVAEMIHNATLVHDDVIDESDRRRGQLTVNARWGNKQAVLVGDFILARATKVLCSIGEPPVIETMAEIVEDLVKGELLQLNGPSTSTGDARFNHYMVKTFYKTGSLFANSCRSVAMLSENCDEILLELATEFGRNLGLAFQLVDDILDYCATEDALGKPTVNDLRLGLATCPVLFAAEEFPEVLNPMIERRFSADGDVQLALELVQRSDGLAQSRRLAREQGDKAIQCADQLLPGGGLVRDCLVDIVRRQLARER